MGEVDLSKSGSWVLLRSWEPRGGEAEKAHSTTPFRWKRRRGRRLLFFCFVENAGAALPYLEKS